MRKKEVPLVKGPRNSCFHCDETKKRPQGQNIFWKKEENERCE